MSKLTMSDVDTLMSINNLPTMSKLTIVFANAGIKHNSAANALSKLETRFTTNLDMVTRSEKERVFNYL